MLFENKGTNNFQYAKTFAQYFVFFVSKNTFKGHILIQTEIFKIDLANTCYNLLNNQPSYSHTEYCRDVT